MTVFKSCIASDSFSMCVCVCGRGGPYFEKNRFVPQRKMDDGHVCGILRSLLVVGGTLSRKTSVLRSNPGR